VQLAEVAEMNNPEELTQSEIAKEHCGKRSMVSGMLTE